MNSDNPLSNRPLQLPEFGPSSLRSICRDSYRFISKNFSLNFDFSIRHYVRQKIALTHKMDIRILCNKQRPLKETKTENADQNEEDEPNNEHDQSFGHHRSRIFPMFLFGN